MKVYIHIDDKIGGFCDKSVMLEIETDCLPLKGSSFMLSEKDQACLEWMIISSGVDGVENYSSYIYGAADMTGGYHLSLDDCTEIKDFCWRWHNDGKYHCHITLTDEMDQRNEDIQITEEILSQIKDNFWKKLNH